MIIKKEGGFNLSKDWSYARMAHNVAVAGGPDKWLEALNKVAFNNGVTYAKKQQQFLFWQQGHVLAWDLLSFAKKSTRTLR